MAEITEPLLSSTNEKLNSSPEFDRDTMRKTKPGLKRFALTLSVLFSFLLGLPFLLKSIEIYRSPLPFGEIDDLAKSIESSSLHFPCRFRAVFVNFGDSVSSVGDMSVLIESKMSRITASGGGYRGGCSYDGSVFVTVESSSGCVRSGDGLEWKCGKMNELKRDEVTGEYDDESIDEYLNSLLDGGGYGGKVYSVIVVRKEDEEKIRAVVGKYRHAWIIGKVSEEEAVKKVAEVFVKVFVNGGKDEGSISGEFMPVGADGRIVLSFNLLNADPRDWNYDWEFQEIDDNLLAPIIEVLKPLADIKVESQVLYHTPKSSFSYWDEKLKSHIFSTNDLPFFVNSNEWHLDTSVAAGGRSKILHLVVYDLQLIINISKISYDFIK